VSTGKLEEKKRESNVTTWELAGKWRAQVDVERGCYLTKFYEEEKDAIRDAREWERRYQEHTQPD